MVPFPPMSVLSIRAIACLLLLLLLHLAACAGIAHNPVQPNANFIPEVVEERTEDPGALSAPPFSPPANGLSPSEVQKAVKSLPPPPHPRDTLRASPSVAYPTHHNHPSGTGFSAAGSEYGSSHHSPPGGDYGASPSAYSTALTDYGEHHSDPYVGLKGPASYGHQHHYDVGHVAYTKPPVADYHYHEYHIQDHHGPPPHVPGPPHGGHNSFYFSKALALKSFLIPLAGVALLGAAAALVTNPVLLQLGVVSGRRRRRRRHTTIFPTHDKLSPDTETRP